MRLLIISCLLLSGCFFATPYNKLECTTIALPSYNRFDSLYRQLYRVLQERHIKVLLTHSTEYPELIISEQQIHEYPLAYGFNAEESLHLLTLEFNFQFKDKSGHIMVEKELAVNGNNLLSTNALREEFMLELQNKAIQALWRKLESN